MEPNQQELYEYARKRVKQKKLVYLHFILLFIGSLFLYIINKWLNVRDEYDWYLWAITAWAFLFILHFIKVFVTEGFINKKWEREQIDKLVARQERHINQLEKKLNNTNDTEQ
ncbi:2TM domain-containing protein [Flavobacterium salilacus subsp. salilacus]|uniref:2TM domain-containing protein n=1 Tax=Flavobacterium TaxID=237 RepID=UPI0010751C70|nr:MULTISPECIES: 2TM domain-containing protein [Flavobacterium]KAF2519939.1 2TM domain-containing protein [Flavobacterium salilacus subsp. salilacus]MBE1614150.1 2TM domain-containing protein [Flavobacterium sp. SaA2.13]NDI97765.1 2TM domain-containing protein [Flavobacterium salilacus subsp. altitudinum]